MRHLLLELATSGAFIFDIDAIGAVDRLESDHLVLVVALAHDIYQPTEITVQLLELLAHDAVLVEDHAVEDVLTAVAFDETPNNLLITSLAVYWLLRACHANVPL